MDKLDAAISIGEKLAKSKALKSFLWGSYSDGSPRSMTDALNDETLSPKQKKKKADKKKKKKKKQKALKKQAKQAKKLKKQMKKLKGKGDNKIPYYQF